MHFDARKTSWRHLPQRQSITAGHFLWSTADLTERRPWGYSGERCRQGRLKYAPAPKQLCSARLLMRSKRSAAPGDQVNHP